MAPEVLNHENYSRSIDYWGLGAIIYEMISGYPPFLCQNSDPHQKVYKNIINSKIKFSNKISKPLRDLMDGLLQADPSARLGFNGIDEIMNHAYFADVDWNLVAMRGLKPSYVPRIKSDHDVHFVDSDTLEFHLIQ